MDQYQALQNRGLLNMIKTSDDSLPCLSDGFRPFFLGAWIYAVVVMLLWIMQYRLGMALSWQHVAPSQVHAHEMLFGYSMAVVSGFLLTAVRNWTGNQTVAGMGLGALFLVWLITRVGVWLPEMLPLTLTIATTALFYAGLLFVVLRSILRAGDQRQWLVVALLTLMAAADLSFLLAVAGVLPEQWMSQALLLGLYLFLGLIQLMAYRVVPFFIGRAIPQMQMPDTSAFRKHFLASLTLFPIMVMADLLQLTVLTSLTALLLGVNGLLVLSKLHHPKIWRSPLVWVLFVAYGFIVMGFFLKAVTPYLGLFPYLAMHVWAYGVIGLMTMGMTPRVTLGHTGHVVLHPPKWMERVLWPAFVMMVIGTLVRTLLPLLAMQHYALWILISQVLWIGAFALLVLSYGPSLVKKSVND